MMECWKCNAILNVDVFQTSNPVRCPRCAVIIENRNAASIQANRYAWRSFWLGLSAVVLLCFTGLPAIWYGVRSLLEMRFTRSQKHDRKAAIAGISLGTLFGVFGSGVALLIGAFVLVFSYSLERAEEPERILEIANSIASVDIPEDFHPVQARRWANQFQRATFRDGAKVETANGMIRLIRAIEKSQFGEMQFGSPTVSLDLHRDLETTQSSEQQETLQWEFAGKPRSITKFTGEIAGVDFRTVRYVGVLRDAEWAPEAFALSIIIRDGGKYSEEDVRRIFASFTPAPR